MPLLLFFVFFFVTLVPLWLIKTATKRCTEFAEVAQRTQKMRHQQQRQIRSSKITYFYSGFRRASTGLRLAAL